MCHICSIHVVTLYLHSVGVRPLTGSTPGDVIVMFVVRGHRYCCNANTKTSGGATNKGEALWTALYTVMSTPLILALIPGEVPKILKSASKTKIPLYTGHLSLRDTMVH